MKGLTMHRAIHRRFVALILAVSMLAAAAPATFAETQDSTGVSVQIVDQGTLDIAWVGNGTPFLVNGETPSLNAGSPSARATSTFTLQITDTRPDASRKGYSIAVDSSAFTVAGTDRAIDPAALSIANVEGLPDGSSAAMAIGSSLDSPVTILTVPASAAALNTTITLTVAMLITPGTPTGEYTGTVSFTMQPLIGP